MNKRRIIIFSRQSKDSDQDITTLTNINKWCRHIDIIWK